MEQITPKYMNILGPFLKGSDLFSPPLRCVLSSSLLPSSCWPPFPLPVSHQILLLFPVILLVRAESRLTMPRVSTSAETPNRDKHGNVFIITPNLFASWMHFLLCLLTVSNESDPACSIGYRWKEQHRKPGKQVPIWCKITDLWWTLDSWSMQSLSLTLSAGEDQVFHNWKLNTETYSRKWCDHTLISRPLTALAEETDAVSITEASASFVITWSSGSAKECLRNIIFAETYVDYAL